MLCMISVRLNILDCQLGLKSIKKTNTVLIYLLRNIRLFAKIKGTYTIHCIFCAFNSIIWHIVHNTVNNNPSQYYSSNLLL